MEMSTTWKIDFNIFQFSLTTWERKCKRTFSKGIEEKSSGWRIDLAPYSYTHVRIYAAEPFLMRKGTQYVWEDGDSN